MNPPLTGLGEVTREISLDQDPPSQLSAQQVIEKIVSGRIDIVVARVQQTLYSCSLLLEHVEPYQSDGEAWNALVDVFWQARSVGMDQNHFQRTKLGMWIKTAHDVLHIPDEELLALEEDIEC